MKVNVVKDKSGRVIATFEKAQAGAPSVTPELDASHTVHEIDVADNYRQNIHALYEQPSH